MGKTELLNLSNDRKDEIVLEYMHKYSLSYLEAKSKLDAEIMDADYEQFLLDCTGQDGNDCIYPDDLDDSYWWN